MSRQELSQGAKANRQGDRLQATIGAELEKSGFILTPLDRSGPNGLRELEAALQGGIFQGEGVFAVKPRVCFGVFGEEFRPHFLLYAKGWPQAVALMSIHQDGSGTARDKVFRYNWTAKKHLPCPCLLVVDGPEFVEDEKVLHGVRTLADWTCGQMRRVFVGFYDFRQWLIKGHPFPEAPDTTPMF